MKSSRATIACYWLAWPTSILAIAMLAQPNIADAADRETPTVAVPRLTDTGLREPSINGPVVIYGTRSASPSGTQSRNVGSERNPAASNSGFQQVPVYGSGWDTEYNSNGLSYTPWNPGQ